MSDNKPLMPLATAVWLVDNTALSFFQISQFCPGSTSALGYYSFGSAVCDDDRVCSIGGHTPVRITLDAEL